MAEEIHQHEVAAAPADLQAEPEGAVGIEREGHRRLADAAALGIAAQKQPVRSSRLMMTVVVWAESPVSRAISTLARLRWRRIRERTRRSL